MKPVPDDGDGDENAHGDVADGPAAFTPTDGETVADADADGDAYVSDRDDYDQKAHEKAMDSPRPALVKLTEDIRGLEQELFNGFQSRRAVLEWTQRLAVRTLGEVPMEWYQEIAAAFRGRPAKAGERARLSALLHPDARTREMPERECKEFRRQISARTIRPAGHRAFRQLRNDAGEYVDDPSSGTNSAHSPQRQRYIAMRPALNDLETHQQTALAQVLDGFSDREDILTWGHDLELATHGEISGSFVTDCYTESPTRRMLISDEEPDERARELFAAHYLIPAFNAGVRDLSGRAKELPDAEREEKKVPKA